MFITANRPSLLGFPLPPGFPSELNPRCYYIGDSGGPHDELRALVFLRAARVASPEIYEVPSQLAWQGGGVHPPASR